MGVVSMNMTDSCGECDLSTVDGCLHLAEARSYPDCPVGGKVLDRVTGEYWPSLSYLRGCSVVGFVDWYGIEIHREFWDWREDAWWSDVEPW